jgi:long-subunit acyl-CoA synthetase (AMP-forming)
MIEIPTSGTTGEKKICLITEEAFDARLKSFKEHYGNVLDTGMQLQKMDVIYSVPVMMAVDKYGKRVTDIGQAKLIVSIEKGAIAHEDINERLIKQAIACEVYIAGGAPMKNEQWKRMSNLLPKAKILSQYGMTETGGICVTDGEELKDGLVGKPYPGVQIRLVDDMVQVKTSGMAISYKHKELPLDNGWFITGDKGYMKDGNLYLYGNRT